MAPVAFAELFRRFYGALESIDLSYFAYGGVAAAIWGDPRVTQDVDAVVVVSDESAADLLNSLENAGFMASASDLFLIDGWLRLELCGRHADVALGRTPFDRSALQRRRRIRLFETEFWIVSAEDLVLYKIIAYRYKDLADAESVLMRQRGQLDLGYMRRWAKQIAEHTAKFEVPEKLEDLIAQTGL